MWLGSKKEYTDRFLCGTFVRVHLMLKKAGVSELHISKGSSPGVKERKKERKHSYRRKRMHYEHLF